MLKLVGFAPNKCGRWPHCTGYVQWYKDGLAELAHILAIVIIEA